MGYVAKLRLERKPTNISNMRGVDKQRLEIAASRDYEWGLKPVSETRMIRAIGVLTIGNANGVPIACAPTNFGSKSTRTRSA